MSQLIKDNTIIDNPWRIIEKDSDFPKTSINANEPVLLPLKLWLAHQEDIRPQLKVGVWLDSDETPEVLKDTLEKLKLIAINFPQFSDGRGYSYARQLRAKLGYEGELRAIGDVLRDQLHFYKRCGFDSYLIREDKQPDQAVNSLNDFSLNYQSTSDNTESVFKRRQL